MTIFTEEPKNGAASPYPLFDFNRAIAAAGNPEEIFQAALVCLHDSLGVDKASALLVDNEGVMRFRAWRNLADSYRSAVEGHAPWTPETKDPQPVLVPDVRKEDSLAGLLSAIELEGIRALAFFPLIVQAQVQGELVLYYPTGHEFSREELLIAQTIAAHVAFALDRQADRQRRLDQEEHLEAMFQSNVVGIIEIDLSAKFITVNDRFCEITGRSREELLSGDLDAFSITHPEDREETRNWLRGLLEGSTHYTIEKRYIRPGGSIVWVSKSVTAIRDEHGALKGAVGVITDVTARKLNDEAIRVSEQRYSDLMSAIGVAVYTTDAEGYITFYNEAAVALWGREPVIGTDKWCGSWHIYTTGGEPVDLDSCPMAIALKENHAVRGAEIVIERPDGSRANVLPHPMPMHDATGKVTGAVNVLIDITDRKNAENALAERNELIQSMTENMSVGLLLLDCDGGIEFMNPAAERLTGYRFEEVRGHNAHDCFHHMYPDGTPYPRESCPIDSTYRKSGRLFGHEDIFVKPDGTLYNSVSNITPLMRNGERIGAVLDIRDITIQKRAETALRESEASVRQAALLKDQFLGLVSHELRTPISTILGNALLLLRRADLLTEDDKLQSLTDIATEADKLQEIIENLLLLTRMEAGQMDLEPLALQQLIEEGIADFKKRNPNRQVTFQAHKTRPASGEDTLVSLVIRNLLSNADKYTPDPELSVDVALQPGEGGWPIVSVHDNGIGLDPDDIERIFNPFFRSQRSKPIAKGMGLGLAVCKRVIEAQGGRIWVESEPEQGSTFYFTLQPAEGILD